jgi:hypothetical protein
VALSSISRPFYFQSRRPQSNVDQIFGVMSGQYITPQQIRHTERPTSQNNGLEQS